MSVRNYTFRAYAPKCKDDLAVFDAMLRANGELYNDLVDVWQDEQDADYKLCRKLSPDVRKLDRQIKALDDRSNEIYEEISSERVLQRTKNPVGVEVIKQEQSGIHKELTLLREKRTAACRMVRSTSEYKEKRVPITEKKKYAIELLTHQDHKNRKGNYNKRVPFGDRGFVQECVKQAAMSKTRKRWKPMRKNHGADFQSGCVCMQINTGSIPITDVFAGNNSRLKLVQSEREQITYANGRTVVSSPKWHDCTFELYDENGRRPTSVRVKVSAEIPSDGVVSYAFLSRKFVADRPMYELRLVVRTPVEARDDRNEDNWFAIRPTYRVDGDRLIAADCKDHTGDKWQIEVPQRCIEIKEESRKIQSMRDNEVMEAGFRIADWAKDRHSKGLSLPELVDSTRGYFHKISPKKLVWILQSWKEDRVDGDEDLYDFLVNQWLPRDKKLWREQKFAERRVERIRKDHYRKQVAELVATYDIAIVPSNDMTSKKADKKKVDVKKTAEMSESEAKEIAELDSRIRRNKALAASATLRTFIAEKFMEGCVSFKTTHSPSKCSQCHKTSSKTKVVKGIVQCFACGAETDRIQNSLELIASEGVDLIEKGFVYDSFQNVMQKEEKRIATQANMHQSKREKSAKRKAESEESIAV